MMRTLITSLIFATLVGCAAPGPRPPQRGESTVIKLDPVAIPSKLKIYEKGKGLIDELKRNGGAQGEYETNDAFAKRAAAVGDFSVLVEASKFSIKFDRQTGAIGYSSTLIDARDMKFTQSAPTSRRLFIPSILLDSNVEGAGDYVGQNAYGASTKVEKRLIENYFLIMGGIDEPLGRIVTVKISGPLEISPDELTKVQPDLALLIVAQQTGGGLTVKDSYGAPKIDHPYESFVKNYYVPARLYALQLVNRKTGKVYNPSLNFVIDYL